MTCLDSHVDQLKDGRVSGLVKMSNFLVQTIHSQRVLDQVVSSHAEELGALGQGFGRDRGRGDLDHDANFQVWIKRNSFRLELPLIFLDQFVSLDQFVQAGNHGVHDLDVAFNTGAENGSKLRSEYISLLQAESD